MQSSIYAGWPVRSCGDARHPFTTAPAKGGLRIHATVRNAARFLIRRLDLRLLALLALLAPVMQAPAQTATPTVTRVSFASSPGSGDAYTRNEVISVRVRFSRAVTLGGRTSINYQTSFDESGFPYVGLTIGGSTRQAVYSHGSGTTALIFSYTVQAGDSDDDGISIAANALRRNGASLVATADDTVEAALSHGAVGTDSSRKVDGSEATRPVIVVEPQKYIANEPIDPLVLPTAAMEDELSSYTLTPPLPDGLTLVFNDVGEPVVVGTPTAAAVRSTHTFTTVDEDGDTVTQTFTIEVDRDLVPSYMGVASPEETVERGTEVRVTLPAAMGGNLPIEYSVDPPLPPGLRFDPATRTIVGTLSTQAGTASGIGPRTASGFAVSQASRQEYTITAVDANGDVATLTFFISVEENNQPSFSTATIPDQEYQAGSDIEPLTLPAATGGDGALRYTVTPALPGGLAFNAATRVLSGAPTRASAERRYTLTATDVDGDTATLSFAISVEADSQPSFGAATIPDQEYRAESEIEPLTLPAATGGDGALSYTVTPALPGGLAFNAATRVLSGAPTRASAERSYTLTATDEDGDAATLSFTITVGEALAPMRGRALESALAGFGRTVATEAVSAISDRFGQTECRSQATLGGRTLTLDSLKGSVNLTSLEEELRYLDRLDYDEWRLSARDFLAGTAFNLSLGRNGLASGNASDPCSPWSVWGRGAFSEFESSDGTDGEVFTGYVGADLRMSSSMLLGVALSHSAGDMDYSLDATPAIPGEVDANLTSVLPYAHWSPIESMGLWGMLGVGWGETTMTDTLGEAETDVEMRMVAIGGHNDLIVAQSTTLAVKVDAFAVELETDEEEGLAKVKSDTERLRLMLESRSELSSTDASRLEVSVEAGGRWDGGDADVGWGLEIGGGLNYRNTEAGLGMAARGRYLVTHRENNFEDWGASIAFSLDPGAPEEGMSLSLTPAWGNAVSQVDTLWQNPLTPGIGNFSSLRRQALDGRHPTARSWRPDSLELKLSYGLPTRSGMGMTKFYTTLSESGLFNRAYRFGTRLTLSEWLKLTFELHRQERNLSDDAPEYGARVGLSLRYW